MRDDKREYEADVHYAAWRSGVSADRIRHEAIDDGYHEGRRPEAIVRDVLQRDEDRRYRESYEQAEYEQAEYEESQRLEMEEPDA